MKNEWYYKSRHEIHGPCPAAELLRLAADAQVLPQDLVRNGRDGPRVRFAYCEDELKQLAAAEERPDRASAGPHGPSGDEASVSSSPGGKETEGEKTASRPTAQRPPQRGTPVAGVLRDSWGIAAAAVLLVTVNWFVLTRPQVDKTAERYSTVLLIYERAGQLETNGSAEQWQEFARDAHERLDPIVADLQKHADVSEPIDQHVLWMGRDYLLPLIDDLAVISKTPQATLPTLRSRVEEAKAEFQNHAGAIERIQQKRVKRARR